MEKCSEWKHERCAHPGIPMQSAYRLLHHPDICDLRYLLPANTRHADIKCGTMTRNVQKGDASHEYDRV